MATAETTAPPPAPTPATPVAAPELSTPGPVDWKTHVPKEYANEAVWSRYEGKPLGDVLKAYAEANKFIGGAIRLPGKDAKPEELQALRTKLAGAGVIETPPATPDAYAVTPPPLPEGTPWDMGAQKQFLESAHKLGLTQSQVQGVMAWYGDFMGQQMNAVGVQQQEAVAQLQKEWGPLFDRKITLASRAIRQVGGDEALDLLNSRGLGDNPVIVRMFARMGEELAEDGFIPGHVEGILTKEDALAAIAKINNDPTDLYHKEHVGKPGRAERVQEVNKLFQLAYEQR